MSGLGSYQGIRHNELLERMYHRLPKEFVFMRELLLSALCRSPGHWRLQAERESEDQSYLELLNNLP
ncbi:MAG: hypothetical protein E6H06_14185 [Bacteroidetes bacterium]|nr:MAG: hypothetical protein E6H06_14185 [Bacteroidota bacterium]